PPARAESGRTGRAWLSLTASPRIPRDGRSSLIRHATTRSLEQFATLHNAADDQFAIWRDGALELRRGRSPATARFTGLPHMRCDRQEDFESQLRALRATHKPKRALREELDRAGLP
ncbi:MAG: hypothetical protein ACRDS0_19330, partial [Pseudonocardiaceae bacterium]